MKLEIGERVRAAARPPRTSLPPGRRAKLRALFPVGAQGVVFFPFVGVAENFVRLVDFLELFLGRLFVLGDVGMVLAREFAEGPADLLVARGAVDAERFVIILKLDSHSSAGADRALGVAPINDRNLTGNLVLAMLGCGWLGGVDGESTHEPW